MLSHHYSSWKQEVARRFDEAAPQYDEYCDVQVMSAEKLASLLPVIKDNDASILEIGCGTGIFTQHLLKKYPNAHYHITDISAKMVEQCRRNITAPDNTSYAVLDGESINTELSYDLIVSNMSFQWFENLEASLQAMYNILRPGGAILFSIPGPDSFPQWTQTLSDLNMPAGILPSQVTTARIIEQQSIEQQYQSGHDFLSRIKKIGAHRPRPDYKPLNIGQLRSACRHFDEEHRGCVTWNIQYCALKM